MINDKLSPCKYCNKAPVSYCTNMYEKGTILKCWCVGCEEDADEGPLPFSEHRIRVYGADKEEAEKRREEINGK